MKWLRELGFNYYQQIKVNAIKKDFKDKNLTQKFQFDFAMRIFLRVEAVALLKFGKSPFFTGVIGIKSMENFKTILNRLKTFLTTQKKNPVIHVTTQKNIIFCSAEF